MAGFALFARIVDEVLDSAVFGAPLFLRERVAIHVIEIVDVTLVSLYYCLGFFRHGGFRRRPIHPVGMVRIFELDLVVHDLAHQLVWGNGRRGGRLHSYCSAGEKHREQKPKAHNPPAPLRLGFADLVVFPARLPFQQINGLGEVRHAKVFGK